MYCSQPTCSQKLIVFRGPYSWCEARHRVLWKPQIYSGVIRQTKSLKYAFAQMGTTMNEAARAMTNFFKVLNTTQGVVKVMENEVTETEVTETETTVETDPLPDPAEEHRVETPDQTVTETEITETTTSITDPDDADE